MLNDPRLHLAIICALLAANVDAQLLPCTDPSRPSDQRWNPSNADTTVRLSHFYAIGKALREPFNAGEFSVAVPIAREYLAEVAYFRCNWNYGNAIHNANVALGMDAVQRGDKPLAAEFLVVAAQSPGSPQLDSFGPTLILAKAVLDAGDTHAVELYLAGIHRFWEMDQGAVDRWQKELASGRMPDFSAQIRPL